MHPAPRIHRYGYRSIPGATTLVLHVSRVNEYELHDGQRSINYIRFLPQNFFIVRERNFHKFLHYYLCYVLKLNNNDDGSLLSFQLI